MTGGPSPAVVRLELRHVAVPLRLPFEASHGTESVREVVVVRIDEADGAVGWGECDALTHPTYTAEYAAGAFALLRDVVGPVLVRGGDVSAGLRWHPMARAAVATARLDAELRRHGTALAAHLAAALDAGGHAVGGAVPPVLARTAVFGRAGSVDQALAWVEAARSSGAALVKLKVAGPADLDVVAGVRAVFPAVPLAADANGALAGIEPADLARRVEPLGLRYLEQPYPADDLLALAELRRHRVTAICLDESVGSLGDARTAHALGALDLVNVKPARLGGPAEAVAVLRWAGEHGVGVFCGGMLELGVGRAAAAAVAAVASVVGGSAGGVVPTDLGPSSAYVERDLAGPVVCDAAGLLLVPAGPGIGVEVDHGVLDAVTRQVAVLGPGGPGGMAG